MFFKNIVQNIASLSKMYDVFRRCFRFQKVHPETEIDKRGKLSVENIRPRRPHMQGGRFWWTESPPKSAQKSTCERRSTQKRALESKCTLLSAQKSAHIFCLAPKRAQEIAYKSKSLKKVLKRVSYSIKCSGEWVPKKSEPLKRVCYSKE